jgi:hypothetical protein
MNFASIRSAASYHQNNLTKVVTKHMTWAGHDFLDAARDETLWNKAKVKFVKPGASFTFELVKEWLKAEMKKRVGLGG